MNRRRMMMQAKSQVHHELEFTDGRLLLCQYGACSYYKVNEGLAICCLLRRLGSNGVTEYRVPMLVSDNKAAAYLSRTFSGSGSIESVTVEYDGKLFYMSAWALAAGQIDYSQESNLYNLPYLNDLVNSELYPYTDEAKRQAMTDLLDYYYGKI